MYGNKRKKKTLLYVFFCVMALGLLGFVVTNARANSGDLRQKAIRFVSDKNSVPVELLEVVNATRVTYSWQGLSTYQYKIANTSSGEVYAMAVSLAGNEVNAEELFASEQEAYSSTYGHIDPNLLSLMRNTPEGSDDKISVAIWFKESLPENNHLRPDAKTNLTQEEVDRIYSETQQTPETFDYLPLADLQRMGIEANSNSEIPAIYTDLSIDQILEISQWTQVDTIYYVPINEEELNVAQRAILANYPQGAGINGDGVKVAQVEVGGRVATWNPYLDRVQQDFTYVCSSASSHSTAVAGIISSTNATYEGISPGVDLRAYGSCFGWASLLTARSDAARYWGARVLNLSWGSNIGLTPGANDRFYDYYPINYDRTVVKSAGNEAGPCNSGTGNVTSPGLGYNTITVGNFDDWGTRDWDDDVMEDCSSFVDPISEHGDRSKPEVAAPGSYITATTTSDPFVGSVGSGTSYAAPMVTGVVAQMMERNPTLQFWPESVKAIIMASANNNIEGNTKLSEYDGAGGINANLADIAARRSTQGVPKRGNWGGTSYSCSTASLKTLGSMNLQADRNLRLAVVWDQNPDYDSYSLRPSADLDISVYDPNGVRVAGSYTWDNTYEVVQFTPTISGTYLIKVYQYRCDLTPKWIGWGWIQQ